MPYIPHTRSDVELMLEAIGVDDIEALFDEIPSELSEDLSLIHISEPTRP